MLAAAGIRVIRIKESNSNMVTGDLIHFAFERSKHNNLFWAIYQAETLIGIKPLGIINVDKSLNDIYKLCEFSEEENSLGQLFPEYLKEWDYESNNGLSPYKVSYGSTLKVWWKCSLNHKWQASITSRTNMKSGCPYCSGKKVLEGFNDLACKNPLIAAEWNYEKNGNLLPTQITDGSSKSVWWRCALGHEWKAKINDRARHGNNCKKCFLLAKKQYL